MPAARWRNFRHQPRVLVARLGPHLTKHRMKSDPSPASGDLRYGHAEQHKRAKGPDMLLPEHSQG